jgi:DNA-binding NarL/FixJ family response regulator
MFIQRLVQVNHPMKIPAPSPLNVPVPADLGSPIKVAVVEDDVSVRRILCEWICQSPGFIALDDHGDAESAISAFAREAPHVALLDINLPGMSGIECVRHLKPRHPATQFVMLTVYDDANHIFDALAAGATGYMVKRTPRDLLLAAVREVFAGGSPMSNDIARKVVKSFQLSRPKEKAAEGLSPREEEVLGLLARGYLYKEISESIGISLPTVSTYIRRIYEKLHVHSRAQAVAVYSDLPLRQDG